MKRERRASLCKFSSDPKFQGLQRIASMRKPRIRGLARVIVECENRGLLKNAVRAFNHAWILCLFCLFAWRGQAQISPGPLAQAHQSLSGATNCTKCHQVSTSSPSFRCLDCHREIAVELQQHKGLHATFPQSGPPGAACVKCHSDHNGIDFKMVHWNPTPKGFDHTKTGYPLDGKHVGVSCRSCHSSQHISAQARPLLAGGDLNLTWLGLLPNCVTCHEDKHQGRLGGDCARCHSTTDWNTATIDRQNFDHSKTRYPLTGQHRNLQCRSCHTPGLDGQPRYSGIEFASCVDPDGNPHKIGRAHV